MNWLELTPQQRGQTLRNMTAAGGFAQALAAACIAADPINERALMAAFPDIVARYCEWSKYTTAALHGNALLEALQKLTNEAWPYLTAAQRDEATAAIAAATGEAL